MSIENAVLLARETDVIAKRFSVRAGEYREARQELQEHIEDLREAIIRLADSIATDMLEASLRVVIAMHNGNSDEAYHNTVAAVRCQRAVENAVRTLQ